MKTKNTKNFLISASLLISFLLFTLMVKFIDVPLGQKNHSRIRNVKLMDTHLFGVNMTLTTLLIG